MKIGTLLSKCMLDLFVNFDKDHWIDYFQSVVALLKLCDSVKNLSSSEKFVTFPEGILVSKTLTLNFICKSILSSPFAMLTSNDAINSLNNFYDALNSYWNCDYLWKICHPLWKICHFERMYF